MITARDLIRMLDGLTIDEARGILQEAIVLLSATQLVSAESPLLLPRREPQAPQ